MSDDQSTMVDDADADADPAAPDQPIAAGSTKIRGGSAACSPSSSPDQVLEIVLENVLQFLTSRRDRNAASLVCKAWYRAEALTRPEVFIGNCYAVSPRWATQRFRRARALVVKGKPRFADFGLVPANWGAHFTQWAYAVADAYPGLERLCLKRMSVTDNDLLIIADSLKSFKELVLVCCEGFSTAGLAIIATKCRQLRVLDLIDDELLDAVDEEGVDWLSCFPETGGCLESLIFDCVEKAVNFDALERLVANSPSLKKLGLNQHVSIGQLRRLMLRAPQLTHLGTGSFGILNLGQGDEMLDIYSAFAACKSLVCLSGFRDIASTSLPAISPVCANLTCLNLSYANITSEQLKSIIIHCYKLQNLWVLDSVRDEGLQAVAATCKDLRELRVFPLNTEEDGEAFVSEVGLVAISEGCRKLSSLLYFCHQMTNAAVVTMSKNCPELVVFRLCIIRRHCPDHLTGEPMDEGFGAIVMNCKKLTRLAVSGLLTDKAFAYIGMYGKLLRTLSVAFAANSDMGLRYLLEGCPNLQKLEIRDSPFGDEGLLSGLHHFYNMRFLWMSSCKLSLHGCVELSRRMPRLVAEVIGDGDDEEMDGYVEKLYLYRSLDEPRNDAPPFVTILYSHGQGAS